MTLLDRIRDAVRTVNADQAQLEALLLDASARFEACSVTMGTEGEITLRRFNAQLAMTPGEAQWFASKIQKFTVDHL